MQHVPQGGGSTFDLDYDGTNTRRPRWTGKIYIQRARWRHVSPTFLTDLRVPITIVNSSVLNTRVKGTYLILKNVVRTDILALFQILERRHSVFHHLICCYLLVYIHFIRLRECPSIATLLRIFNKNH